MPEEEVVDEVYRKVVQESRGVAFDKDKVVRFLGKSFLRNHADPQLKDKMLKKGALRLLRRR
ncbi:hypothetical protein [Parafrankia sp. EUN1f]|uniref:hypothetical protein n=1 Tax=Parafrankia sp. EUN1f TaxID=102897 RepID=UPI0012F8C2AB|nr:hypothetical protein [Parafrankia sp. EUN1f]